MSSEKLLAIHNLVTQFRLDDGLLTAVDKVSFFCNKGETLGVVGESGCGKSVTAFSILNLVPPPGRITGGEILFENENLLTKSKSKLQKIRGKDIAMIFQEPMTSLHPVFSIGSQITETLKIHMKMTGSEAKERAIELLRTVKIPNPEQRFREYPHQLSGGMRQRVMIAIALSCNPKLLICDEPTTALDVTVQAQILRLINKIKKTFNMSVIIITHDLAVVSEIAERVIVMYAGRVIEESVERDIFVKPLHPYTEALLKSIPSSGENGERLYMIKGMVPNLLKKHSGCLFAPRCDYAAERCFAAEPALVEIGARKVRCFKYAEKAEERP